MSIAVDYPALRDISDFTFVEENVAVTSPKEVVEAEPDSVFSAQQIQEFRADDAAAMGTIARIMTTLFAYTVVIMLVTIAWTFAVVS